MQNHNNRTYGPIEITQIDCFIDGETDIFDVLNKNYSMKTDICPNIFDMNACFLVTLDE